MPETVPAQLAHARRCLGRVGGAADLAHAVDADALDTERAQLGLGLLDALLVEDLDDAGAQRDAAAYGLDDVGAGAGVAAAAIW
ncbi:hypothetical protein ACWDFH_14480 [Streptomyces kronopolitis]|uniref:hypothetical protein n=1 Tax=Streptomyces kronopolitis TaxID=1612435 RepID=UPI0036A2ACD6